MARLHQAPPALPLPPAFLPSPDLIVVGGGISARHKVSLPRLRLDARVVPAQLRNVAAIMGAARHAYLTAPSLQ